MNPWTGLIKKVAPVRPAAVQPRSYYALGLLKHGALTLTEFRAITGWSTNAAAQVLFQMVRNGVVKKSRFLGTRCFIYGLCE